MPIPRDSAFQTLSQAGDGRSMPRTPALSRGKPKGARNARGLDGADPVWPLAGAIHRHHQKYQGFSGLNEVGATRPTIASRLRPTISTA